MSITQTDIIFMDTAKKNSEANGVVRERRMKIINKERRKTK